MSCPDCFTGALQKGTTTGSITTIHGLNTYVARPEGTPKALIVFTPDAYGWDLPNNRILADYYAAEGGFLVYLPDVMNGHSAPNAMLHYMDALLAPAAGILATLLKPYYILRLIGGFVPFVILNRPSICEPRIIAFFQALRLSPSTCDMKVFQAGFCWGGRYSFILAADRPADRVVCPSSEEEGKGPQRLVDAVFTAHPSNLVLPGMAEAVAVPTSVVVGDVDMALGLEKVQLIKAVLEKKKDGAGHEVVIVPGAKHGFSIRGELDDPLAKEHAEIATRQALSWFARWLG